MGVVNGAAIAAGLMGGAAVHRGYSVRLCRPRGSPGGVAVHPSHQWRI